MRPDRRGKREPTRVRPEAERLDPSLDPPARDLFDSPSDSWRDLELRELLDQIESRPTDR